MGDGLPVDGSDALRQGMMDRVALTLAVGNALEGKQDTVHSVGIPRGIVEDGIGQLGQDSQYRFADPILSGSQHLQIGKT